MDGLIGPRGGRLRHGRDVCLFVLVVGCGCGQKTMIYSRLMHVIADDYSFVLYQNVHKATLSRVYYYQMESMNSWDQQHSFHTHMSKMTFLAGEAIFRPFRLPPKIPGTKTRLHSLILLSIAGYLAIIKIFWIFWIFWGLRTRCQALGSEKSEKASW